VLLAVATMATLPSLGAAQTCATTTPADFSDAE
jgi:hypothetical protein